MLLGGALLGIALLLFGGMSTEREVEQEPDTLTAREEELSRYEQRVEEELEVLLESVGGVRDVLVMVTFESGYTVRYAKDGEGDPVTVGSGSNEEALFATVVPPPIAGIGVVCHGGNDPGVRQTLTELISTALGISSNRVYITGK